jgi:hypothetical protein
MHSEFALSLAVMLSAIAGPVSASSNAKSASHFTLPVAFDVLFANSTARVHFAGGEYFLQERRSSLGTKFVSPTATLIVDGEYMPRLFQMERLTCGSAGLFKPIASP